MRAKPSFAQRLSSLRDLPLLLIRLVLAYGFYGPASMKWKDIHGIGDWFMQLHIPFPYISAYVAAVTEALGVVLLVLGLFVRYISIPLMITMVVAIITVHWANGFEAGDNGYEIPLYYILFLFTLFVFGSGRIGIDYFLERKR
ncbi:HvfX family Cu-binding RiPP maturation protein [Chitinophaga nivalis]|uniref:DoxX family protein n=1 Tax=Chitinophaga nivalis TaxID=2991709 RepID=A0ABT3IR06_9BACT|nr:DoxX family protein [Chitinophaga nivalis]MCW3463893.1 DoxX family protein [Chitinophaga nivalis]MCW3486417.1 DoxX family protein [Chitinophaga nivalis]